MDDFNNNRPPNLIPPFPRNKLSASHLGKLSRAINRGNSGIDPPYQVVPDVIASVGDNACMATIVSVHDNYLVCTDESGNDINVALPNIIRRDTPDGGSCAPGGTTGTRDGDTITYTGTQTRTVTKTSAAWTPEDQTIGPTTYQAGDKVFSVPYSQSVNGDATGTVDCTFVAVDGRAWGPVPAAD